MRWGASRGCGWKLDSVGRPRFHPRMPDHSGRGSRSAKSAAACVARGDNIQQETVLSGLLAKAESTAQWATRHGARFASRPIPDCASSCVTPRWPPRRTAALARGGRTFRPWHPDRAAQSPCPDTSSCSWRSAAWRRRSFGSFGFSEWLAEFPDLRGLSHSERADERWGDAPERQGGASTARDEGPLEACRDGPG